jgi:hypothetical protein
VNPASCGGGITVHPKQTITAGKSLPADPAVQGESTQDSSDGHPGVPTKSHVISVNPVVGGAEGIALHLFQKTNSGSSAINPPEQDVTESTKVSSESGLPLLSSGRESSSIPLESIPGDQSESKGDVSEPTTIVETGSAEGGDGAAPGAKEDAL